MLAYVVLLGIWGVLGTAAALVAIPWTLATRDLRFLYRAGIAIMRTGLRAAGIHTVVEGRTLIPLGVPCLYMANHQSNLDPPVLATVQPGNAAMMVKQSLMRIPLMGVAMRLGRFIPVERSGSLESARQSLRAAAGVLRSGMSITVFPEGTRSPDGHLLPFKKGPFLIAMQTGALVVPVTIRGTGAMLSKGSQRLHPGTAHVTFHPPLDPRSFPSREALLDAVRLAIASALPAT